MSDIQINSYDGLIKVLCDGKFTMVKPEYVKSLLNFSKYLNNVEGDIMECGVWRGGTSIFLSYLFPNRNIWICDSFCGFQPKEENKYECSYERHTPEFIAGADGAIGVSLPEVKGNFARFGLEEQPRIKFLEGFVKNTLPTAGVEKLALLRIDVDGYSATLEVLDEMYHKVQKGGYIVFDDSCLFECWEAIKFFLERENLPEYIIHPLKNELLDIHTRHTEDESGFPTGCYIIKQ